MVKALDLSEMVDVLTAIVGVSGKPENGAANVRRHAALPPARDNRLHGNLPSRAAAPVNGNGKRQPQEQRTDLVTPLHDADFEDF